MFHTSVAARVSRSAKSDFRPYLRMGIIGFYAQGKQLLEKYLLGYVPPHFVRNRLALADLFHKLFFFCFSSR